MLSLPKSRPVALAASAAVFALALGACSSTEDAGDAIEVAATDSTCTPASTELAAGNSTFRMKNDGSKVNELYVLRPDGSIVSERENIVPGTSAELTVELTAGEYSVRCRPGMTGDGIITAIKVSGEATSADPRLDAAVAGYRTYVQAAADDSQAKTKVFTDALAAGDVAAAKAAFAPSRVGWETVEPVAESFGDLDPEMDLREADLEAGQEWTGWHALEKKLWVENTTDGTAELATKLNADLAILVDRVRRVEITATSMSNGAKELLDEVATGKITGEEDIFSHTDLSDFQANVDGAEKVFTLLQPVLKEKDADLDTEIAGAFSSLQETLKTYKTGSGPADFVDYSTVDETKRKDLSAKVNALAEPLSGLAAAVTG